MRRPWTQERGLIGGKGRLLPPGPAGSSAPPADTPLTILGAAVIQWQRPDLGVTLNGSNVATWEDQSAAGNDDSQGSAPAQPLFIASDAGANNRPGIQFDGTATYTENAIARPAPATTSTLIWTVLRQESWTSGDSLFAGIHGASNIMCVAQQASSPELRMLSTTAANTNSGCAVGQVKRCAWYFSGSVNDFAQLAATLVSGNNAGNVSGSTGHRKGANRAATVFSNWTVFDWVMASGLTPAEATAAVSSLDSYGSARFGAGILT